MYILDTDHVSLLQRKSGHESERLRFRLVRYQRATTIITYEEQTRGWLAWIAKSRTLAEQVERYKKLSQSLTDFNEMIVLDFDERAAEFFQDLQKQRLRIGTMDLKIAAIAIANNATLLSRNLKDFGKIPTLQVEDWAA